MEMYTDKEKYVMGLKKWCSTAHCQECPIRYVCPDEFEECSVEYLAKLQQVVTNYVKEINMME